MTTRPPPTPIKPSLRPPFPEIGSTLSSKYFCLGRLGKGTFCSIHKCVDLSYSHQHAPHQPQAPPPQSHHDDPPPQRNHKRQRIVAAKAELANFVDSGVIDGEAYVLNFLHAALPRGMVPTFVDYVHQCPSVDHGMGVSLAPASSASSLGVAALVGGATTGTTTANSTINGGEGVNNNNNNKVSAIIMEYLPGEDMHLLRDRHCQSLLVVDSATNKASSTYGVSGNTPRRVSIQDAVYLVADVMLPLLKAMHEVGVVHRDVKPSNVVRTGTTATDRNFKIVDFGLSKSFVVPKDSPFANPHRPWKGLWMAPNHEWETPHIPSSHTTTTTTAVEGGCIRLERESAEFRGTSMYASLRVHQGKDHCPRDDIWGLLYVFCDLVSGGLPWMSHAASRDRNSCQILKEMVLGERGREDWEGSRGGNGGTLGGEEAGGGRAYAPNPECVPKDGGDAMEWLLYGAEYHMAKYKRDHIGRLSQSGAVDAQVALPEPLALSKNVHYVECLRKAFRHVASLGFVQMPNYELIDECLRGFLRDSDDPNVSSESVPPIDWTDRRAASKRRRYSYNNSVKSSVIDTGGVAWDLLDEEDADPLDHDTLLEAENDRRAALEAAAAAMDDVSRVTGGASSVGNLTAASNIVSTNLDPGGSLSGEAADLARLPLQLQFYLSQVEYNAQHPDSIPIHLALRDWMALAVPLAHGTWDAALWERGNHRTDDDGYRNEVYMSMLQKCLYAAEPFNNFADRNCFYYPSIDGVTRKRRRIGTSSAVDDTNIENESPLLVVSRVFFLLRLALDLERGKNFAPPPKLSFGFGR
eukprot:CCRYP_017563-RA/>CCRYP_017563-RA protein AED:0.08 eAED:0.08 QI:115/1/0.5/1/1/1/2/0/807